MNARLVLAALLALVAVPAPAHAVPSEPTSLDACRYWSPVQDQYPYDYGRQYTVLWSDPVYVGPEAAVLTCTIQLGTDITHNGADAVARSSASTPGVVALVPTAVAYDIDGWFSVCSQVTYADGRSYYWNGESGGWSTDPSVPCYTPPPWYPPPQELPFALAYGLDSLAGPVADPVLCPVLASSPLLRDYDGPVWIAPDGTVWIGGWEAWWC